LTTSSTDGTTEPVVDNSALKLFREDAINARRPAWHGDVILSQPPATWLAVILASALASLLVGFISVGKYTRRITIAGQLSPADGVAKLYVAQGGVIVDERVHEGQIVHKDDVLFVVSSERQTHSMGDVQAAISEETTRQVRSADAQLTQLTRMEALEQQALDEKIASLQQELPTLQQLLGHQRDRADLDNGALRRYQRLHEQGFVTQDQYEQKQSDALDQRSRLDSLEREVLNTQRLLSDAKSQLSLLPLKYGNQRSDLERSRASLRQNLLESEGRRQIVVVATEAGTVTAITAHRGQRVDANAPLASIVPEGTPLQATLYAPSRAIGFVTPGATVQIRYEAFPYQKFGQHTGRVVSVATTALSSSEITRSNLFETGAARQGGEPLYQIAVRLPSQAIEAYGTRQPLRAGMLIQADILQDERRIFEWVLEPLYGLGKKL
jgi:membrane fusion protein